MAHLNSIIPFSCKSNGDSYENEIMRRKEATSLCLAYFSHCYSLQTMKMNSNFPFIISDIRTIYGCLLSHFSFPPIYIVNHLILLEYKQKRSFKSVSLYSITLGYTKSTSFLNNSEIQWLVCMVFSGLHNLQNNIEGCYLKSK